eukprot:293157-Prymnesium_polylepis.1
MRNVDLYVRDALKVFVELPAHTFTVSALLINVVGTFSGEDLSDSPALASAAQQLFAIGLVLQWIRLLRLLQMTVEFGPTVMMLINMGTDLFNFSIVSRASIIGTRVGVVECSRACVRGFGVCVRGT